jgi:hypothetical protein
MPTVYKVLGQLLPASTSGTLYTVPAATDTVVSTINAVNTGSTTADISIAIRPAGATIETKNYITVESTTNDVAFNAFGSEITA